MRVMSPLTRPTGPEPERTYWIRRGVLAVAVLTTIALAGWVVSMLFGSNSATASPEPSPERPHPRQSTRPSLRLLRSRPLLRSRAAPSTTATPSTTPTASVSPSKRTTPTPHHPGGAPDLRGE